MNSIIITCNHLETSESVNDFINLKFKRLFHHYEDIIRIRVELNLDSGQASEKRFVTRAILELRGPDIVATSVSENAYASLDATLRKVERQLRHRVRLARYKRERIINRMKRSARIPSTMRSMAST